MVKKLLSLFMIVTLTHNSIKSLSLADILGIPLSYLVNDKLPDSADNVDLSNATPVDPEVIQNILEHERFKKCREMHSYLSAHDRSPVTVITSKEKHGIDSKQHEFDINACSDIKSLLVAYQKTKRSYQTKMHLFSNGVSESNRQYLSNKVDCISHEQYREILQAYKTATGKSLTDKEINDLLRHRSIEEFTVHLNKYFKLAESYCTDALTSPEAQAVMPTIQFYRTCIETDWLDKIVPHSKTAHRLARLVTVPDKEGRLILYDKKINPLHLKEAERAICYMCFQRTINYFEAKQSLNDAHQSVLDFLKARVSPLEDSNNHFKSLFLKRYQHEDAALQTAPLNREESDLDNAIWYLLDENVPSSYLSMYALDLTFHLAKAFNFQNFHRSSNDVVTMDDVSVKWIISPFRQLE